VIICDWGLARILSTPEDVATEYMEAANNPDLVNPITLNGFVRGTPGYMAPEQVSSGGKKTYATDIYGLGAILYCILTGKPPIEGGAREVFEKTRRGEIAPLPKAGPNIPRALGAVAMKALHLDAEQRYQCVEHLIADIHNYTQGYVTSAENASLLKIMGLFYKRRHKTFIATALVLAGFAALSSFYVYRLSRSRAIAMQERTRAQHALQKIVEEQRVSASLRHDIGRTAIDAANMFWKEPLQNPGGTKKIFTDAIAELDRALAINPRNTQAWGRKGFLCFLMQRFNEATDCLKHAGSDYSALKPLCRRYGQLKPDDQHLDSAQFAAIAAEIMEARGIRGESTVELMLLYDYAAQRISLSHAKNILSVLKLWDPAWKEPVFRYARSEDRLVLGGDGLKRFKSATRWRSNENILRTLHLKHLVFTNTDFSDFSELKFLQIGSLDISRTKVKNLKGLARMPTLIELTVREGQFTPEQLKDIQPGIRVVIVP